MSHSANDTVDAMANLTKATTNLIKEKERYERHIHTLLAYLSGVASNHPEAVSETTRAVATLIAREIGSCATFPKQ